MADHFEHPGHDELQGGPPPEGDFPADFFDDETEPSPVSHNPQDPDQDQPKTPAASPPKRNPDPLEQPLPPPGAPSTFKAPPDLPEDDERESSSPFAAILGFVMLGVVVAAWFVSKQKSEPAPAPAASATPAPSSVVESKPAAEPAKAETEALEAKVKDLTGKVDELTAQIKTIEGKLSEQPKAEPSSDLKSLEGKVDELSKSVAGVKPLNDKVGKLSDRVGSVDSSVTSIKSDLAAVKDEVSKLAASSTTKPAAAAASETKPDTDDTGNTLNQGVALFKSGDYKGADEVFKKLASTDPKDARVYYYAALTHGLTTGSWQGETLATAAKGAALEKAGSTKSSDVDATFADLPANLKPWITYFRAQSK